MALTKVSRGLLSTSIVDNGNATAITIDANENVGIGGSPAYKLDVASPVIQFGDSTDAFAQYKSSAGNWHVGANSSNAFAFYSGTYGSGTERMRIDSSGNVDITTGNLFTDATSGIFFSGGIGSFTNGIYGVGVNNVAINAGGSERMRISANGYVNPKANVANTNAPDTQGLHFGWNYSNGAGESLIVFNKGAGTTGGLTFVDNSSSGTHDEIMRLEGGNLLVGTTTTGSYTDGKLSVFGDGSVPAATFKNAGNTGQFCANFWNAAGSGTRTLINFTTNASPSVVGSISTNGSTTAYNTSSDYRLKENIADADDAGSKVDAIQVRKFDWIADGAHQDYGMVAQELQTVAPEAVSAPEDPEEMMGVDYSKLVPMLVKEIQSLRARVQQLENN